MIAIKNLLIQRNGRDALKIESLDIRKGETLAVVGPNGAGKSTFLLVLARLLKSSRGDISMHGKPQREWKDLDYRRRIAFVFQDPLLMDMSVCENIALGLKFRSVDKKERHERVHRWAKAMGVEKLLERRAGQLSGGEAQRVSLARAFVLDPELLLMDEPFSAVDPQTREKLLEDLSRVLGDDHRTTIFVTHNLKEASQFGDRVAVIINHELKQVGKPKEIKNGPADASVRDFVRGL
ncbi:MAG: ATP-binding cassette domain-containing protein [Anaerolineales bacterium]|nr:ATP-binding cassette domain-containing protein [Anaerolineales bacterium]